MNVNKLQIGCVKKQGGEANVLQFQYRVNILH
jgi:hypothetical protein